MDWTRGYIGQSSKACCSRDQAACPKPVAAMGGGSTALPSLKSPSPGKVTRLKEYFERQPLIDSKVEKVPSLSPRSYKYIPAAKELQWLQEIFTTLSLRLEAESDTTKLTFLERLWLFLSNEIANISFSEKVVAGGKLVDVSTIKVAIKQLESNHFISDKLIIGGYEFQKPVLQAVSHMYMLESFEDQQQIRMGGSITDMSSLFEKGMENTKVLFLAISSYLLIDSLCESNDSNLGECDNIFKLACNQYSKELMIYLGMSNEQEMDNIMSNEFDTGSFNALLMSVIQEIQEKTPELEKFKEELSTLLA